MLVWQNADMHEADCAGLTVDAWSLLALRQPITVSECTMQINAVLRLCAIRRGFVPKQCRSVVTVVPQVGFWSQVLVVQYLTCSMYTFLVVNTLQCPWPPNIKRFVPDLLAMSAVFPPLSTSSWLGLRL